MRLGCLLPIASAALLFAGGQGFYTVATNRKPVEISIQDFNKQPPGAKWLKVTGGELDTFNSVFPSRAGSKEAKEIYVPVVAPGEDSTKGTIRLLLLTKDPELVNFVNESNKIDDGTLTPDKAMEFAAKHADKIHPKRDVEGLVQFGIDDDSKKRDKMGKLYPNMDSDAIILKDGEKPDWGKSIIFLVIGLVLGLISVRGLFKKQDPAQPTQQPPPPMPSAG